MYPRVYNGGYASLCIYPRCTTVGMPPCIPWVYNGGYASLGVPGCTTVGMSPWVYVARCTTVGRHPGGYITRFTVWLGKTARSSHPFHCWARKEPAPPSPVSLLVLYRKRPFSHPFHCWFCTGREPSSLTEQRESWWEEGLPASQNRRKKVEKGPF